MSSEMLVEAQINEVKGLVRAQFYHALQAKALVQVQSDELTSARQRLANAKLREAAGDVSRFDVMRLETDAKRSEQALLDAEGAYTLAKQNLNSILGRAIETDFDPADVAPKMDVQVAADDAVAMAQQNRPEVKSNDFLVQAADRLVGVQAGGLKPSLSFSAQYSRVIDPAPGQFENSLFGVLNLSVPLYDSGITRNRTVAARAFREQAQIRLEQVRLGVSSDVRGAITRLETTKKGYEVAQAGLEFARESLRLAQLRYDEGAGILLDVTTAQGELTRARAALVTAQYQYLSAVAALQRAIGSDDLTPQGDSK
jgi:outer membrane protein TolC